jgi:PIN domain nuclease of toxin-antitoxin system
VPALILDTCAVLWVANKQPISQESRSALEDAAAIDAILVSPISAWEVANLVRKSRITLSMPTDAWFDAMLALPGMRLAPMPPRTLIASSFLPGDAPNDPADRIIAATARAENLVLVTRDAELLAYADTGHVRAMKC